MKKTANASPLGFLGFGMTTILYSMAGASFFNMNTMLLSMAIFLGGITQIIAGLLEYKKEILLDMFLIPCLVCTGSLQLHSH